MEQLLITAEMSYKSEQVANMDILLYSMGEGQKTEFIVDIPSAIDRMINEFMELGCFVYVDPDWDRERIIKPAKIMVGQMVRRIRRRVMQKPVEPEIKPGDAICLSAGEFVKCEPSKVGD